MRKILAVMAVLILSAISYSKAGKIVIDSKMTLKEAIGSQVFPAKIRRGLRLLTVRYYSFDGKLHQGQLVVHKNVRQDIKEIFEIILRAKFPIQKVIPVVKYNFSDDASMADNNTSAFCFRDVPGTKIRSKHSYGIAIDINPMQNPYITKDKWEPPGSVYDVKAAGTIVKGGVVYNAFIERGWIWGGDWKTLKDYHHFQKTK